MERRLATLIFGRYSMNTVLWYFVFGICFYPAFLVIRQQFFILFLKEDVGVGQRLGGGTFAVLTIAFFVGCVIFQDLDSGSFKSLFLHSGATILGFLFLPGLFETLIYLAVLKRKLQAPDPASPSR
jgi:hypothetical protein